MRSIFRYRVGLQYATLKLTGKPVAVAATRYPHGIEFWAEHDDSKPEVQRTFAVIGTGNFVPDNAVYVGTAPRTIDGIVWHLYELKES